MTPFECSISPRAFWRFTNDVFRYLIRAKIGLAKDEEEAIARLAGVLKGAADAGLEINWKKCQSLKDSVEFLGYIVENGNIKPSPLKTNAVQKFPEPKTIKELQSFLGLSGYFRKFIENYATIARLLSDLLRLMNDPVLKIYREHAETKLHTEASELGLRAVLLQRCNDEQQMHPVYYMSTKTSVAEEKYNSYTLETLRVVSGV